MAGFDPNQPRDEIGQWTIAGNAARKAAGLEEGEKLWENVVEDLPKIADKPTEHLRIYSQDGEYLGETVGDEKSVTPSAEIRNDIYQGVIFHNHPKDFDDSNPVNTSGLKYAQLSAGDWGFAAYHDVKATAIVSGDYFLGIEFPEGAEQWAMDFAGSEMSEDEFYGYLTSHEFGFGVIDSIQALTGKYLSSSANIEKLQQGDIFEQSRITRESMNEALREMGLKVTWKKWR